MSTVYTMTEEQFSRASDRLCQAKAVAAAMLDHEIIDNEVKDVFWAIQGLMEDAFDTIQEARHEARS